MAGCLFPQQITEKGNRIWVILPAAFGTGVLMLTWAVYVVSWMFSVCAGAEHPLFYGNLLVMLVTALIFLMNFHRKRKNGKTVFSAGNMVTRRWILKKEICLFVILAFFVTWIMFYVFHMKDGVLYSGFSVYGDYAPHTAMMRSFSRGNNFPTQYPHYGGQDVKYHFMFQFLVGNLEYLEHGGRIGKVASIAGKLLNVKPLITLKDGEIYSPGLKRGRKKSMAGTIDLLLDYMEENGYTPENCSLVIGYCYGYEEAESFQKMLMQSLEEKFGTTETVPIHRIGATIGVHTGPYAIGIGIIRRSDMV